MKKKILTIILMLTLFIMPIMAEELKGANCVADNCGTEVAYDEESYVSAGETVTYGKNADGAVLLAGNVITYTGSNNGISMLAGNNVKSQGYSEYALLAGNNIDLQAGVIEKDLFVAGNIINVDATIYRDALIVGSNVTLYGHVGRNLTIYASNVTLDNAYIDGDVRIEADTITIKDQVAIDGKLTYGANDVTISEKANIASTEKIDIEVVKVTFASTLKGRVISYASLLLVFALLALLVPVSLKNVGDEKLSFVQIITYMGYALVFLILVPVAALILMMLTIGLPVALMMLGLYFAAIYLAYAYMGYYIGKKIWLAKNKEENVLLEGLIGITILYAISLIPTVGGVITFLAYLCGIGIIIFKFKK